jgi:hypothetical protein
MEKPHSAIQSSEQDFAINTRQNSSTTAKMNKKGEGVGDDIQANIRSCSMSVVRTCTFISELSC